MADTVSKLYAEIGFKVNQDGLKQAQRILADMANQMSAINNATKEAAKQYGVFSKDKNKQAMADAKLATENERAESQRSKRALDNKKFEHKQLMDLAKLEFQVEKYNAAEKQKIERQQTKEAEKAAREQKKRLSNMLHSFRSFAVGLRNTFLTLSGIAGGGMVYGMKQSLDRAMPTRDFLMTTGVDLEQLQGVMSRMVNVGSRMSQQQIMGDIQKVSQNLSDIALGQGELSPYKLLHVAAQRGDVMGVIRGVEQSVKGLDNAMALNLTRRVGLSDDWLASWRFKERYGGDQIQLTANQQRGIDEASIAINQLKYSFRLLSDQVTSALAPAMTEISDILRDSFQSAAAYIKEHSDFIKEINWKELGENINKIASGIKTFIDGFMEIPRALYSGASKIAERATQGVLSFVTGGKEDHLIYGNPGKAASVSGDTQGIISRFASSPNRTAVISAIDNSTFTINGVAQDEIAEKVKDIYEEEKQKSNRETWLDNLYSKSDLFVVSSVIGNASARS